ncbi:MAG: Ig-like domain-containing protein [Clostridia bacterium]|nr:Ig-like domain-containing protein [Clostridia bacterium]
MKKVILCLLLLIPILVILTIDASGKLIATALVDIPVESVLIKHGGEVLESQEIYLEDYKDTDKKFTVFCEVFPGIATDKMIWESSDPRIAEVVPDAKREDAADVIFHDYGTVDIVCTSEKNSSITARATLYIGGLIPGRLEIGDYTGNYASEITIPRYGVKSLLASVKPARSVKEEKIAWSSENPSLVKVDNNGVITALAEGTTAITETVTARGVTVTDSVQVTVSGTALVREREVYVVGDTIDLTPYLTDGATVLGGNVVTTQELAAFESKQVTVQKDGATDSIRVVKVDTTRTLVVENYYALAEGALSAYLALGTSNLELRSFALDGGAPSIAWRSSNEEILRVVDARVYAVGSGTAYVYPYAEGYVGQRVTINVTSPVEDFRLYENPFKDSVGLLQERVFGNVTYRNGNYTNNYQMRILSVYPAGIGIEAFTFESADTEVATVTERGLVTFKDNVDGKTVTISATAYNQEGMPVRQLYTFHLVKGVNVGYGEESNIFDKSKGEKPSFSSYDDFRVVAANPNAGAIVLLADVYFRAKSDGGVTIKNTACSIYGNGKKLDGQFFTDSVEDGEKLLLWDFAEYPDMPKHLSVRIVNTNLQATQPTSDDAEAAFTELSAKGGGAIGTRHAYPSADCSFDLYVQGCLFQYAYGHVNVSIGDNVFDGCIFRNNSASAIVLQQSSYGVANAKIKNCIFSNTIAPVGIACGNFDDILERFKSKNGLSSQFGKFELEGTNYVYNWKMLKEVQMNLLPQNLANNTASDWVGIFNDKLGKIIQEAFEMSEIDNLYVENVEEYYALDKFLDRKDYLEKNAWLNFSFLMIGIWENINPQVNAANPSGNGINVVFDEEQYQMIKVYAEDAPSIGGLIGYASLLGADVETNETYHIVCRDKSGIFNTKPGETYTIGPEVYARLRGEKSERV